MLTYRRNEISLWPKLTAPKLFFNWRNQPKNLTSCDTFYFLNYFRRAVCRRRLHQKVDVIAICFNFQANVLEYGIHIIAKKHSTILGRVDKTVHDHRYIVAFRISLLINLFLLGGRGAFANKYGKNEGYSTIFLLDCSQNSQPYSELFFW